MKGHIPNLITLLNLLSGAIATVLAVQNNLITAAAFVGLGIFFDFFDGLAARALDVKSEIGLQLDSLADMVTSGLVPGIVMFQLLSKSVDYSFESDALAWSMQDYLYLDFSWIAIVGFLVTLGSAYRLAKFNIDERQTSSFIGLPTPANAILILSFPLILTFQPGELANTLLFNTWFLVGLSIVSGILLNAEIALFALKFKTYALKPNWFRYLFLLLCAGLIIFLEFWSLPIIILLYIVLSLIVKESE